MLPLNRFSVKVPGGARGPADRARRRADVLLRYRFPSSAMEIPASGTGMALLPLPFACSVDALPSAAYLAAYARLALVVRRAGSSIRGESPASRGNK
jgi:hypothetical protein